MTIAEKVAAAARRHGVPEDLALRLARQESGLRQWRADGLIVKSSSGALGVMQLMPATARDLGVDPYNEDQNIDGGVRYLKQMHTMFGNWNHAVAAYNTGPGNLRKVLRGEKALHPETAAYVPAILGVPFQPVPGQPVQASQPPPSASPPFCPGRAKKKAARPGRLK